MIDTKRYNSVLQFGGGGDMHLPEKKDSSRLPTVQEKLEFVFPDIFLFLIDTVIVHVYGIQCHLSILIYNVQ